VGSDIVMKVWFCVDFLGIKIVKYNIGEVLFSKFPICFVID